MSHLIDCLKSLNSKERFFLVGQALGNPAFTLCDSFLELLSKALGLDVPASAFVAMDFHLDWLYAALWQFANPTNRHPWDNSRGFVRANQEDIDLLAAFDTGDACHIVLIEAKGVTGWINSQMNSKAQRLGMFFGDDGRNCQGVVPHFVLASPGTPQRLDAAQWPRWMRERMAWIELNVPASLARVSRCDAAGKSCSSGTYCTIVAR